MQLFSKFLCALVLCALSSGAWAGSSEMEAKRQAEIGLAPGVVLGKDNAALAEGMLPPEILDHYKQDEYVNPIAE